MSHIRQGKTAAATAAAATAAAADVSAEAPRVSKLESRAKPVASAALMTTSDSISLSDTLKACQQQLPSCSNGETLCEMDRSRLKQGRSSTSTRSLQAGSSGVKLFRGSDANETAQLAASTVERPSGISFL
jgi:hypothetical protein